jgi:PEGA domain-containing protein
MIRLLALLAALQPLPAAALAASHPAAPPTGASDAFLGLRPTEDAAFGATRIDQLPDAQRLRAVAEGVVELLLGVRVLGHDDLRGLLGRGYLADAFDCRGEATCLLRVTAPLRKLGVKVVTFGDLFSGADTLRVRVRRLDLATGKLAGEATFSVPRAEAELVPPWRAGLAPLVTRAGSLLVVSNQPDAGCTLDGNPCEQSASGAIDGVAEGEHVVELSKEGFRRASRVVTVRSGTTTRVGFSLEEVPVQAQRAPDPAARLPTFAAPSARTQLTPFGSARLALVADDVNAGDREDPSVPPGVRPGPWTTSALPRPVVLGVAVQAPRSAARWQLRGAVSLAWVRDAGPEIDSAYAELLDEEAGWRVMLGWAPSVVSTLTAGTLTLPEGFGDLAPAFVGATGSYAVGGVLLEATVGKQKGQFSPTPEPGQAVAAPFLAGHLAWVSKDVKGTLYGDDYPLTLGISGAFGDERVGGAAEQAWAAGLGIAAPRREAVRAWLASAEAFVPLGGWGSLAGEAWVGDDVQLFEGALWQVPRVDPGDGRHRALRSAGGWAQLAVQLAEGWEALAVAGTDQVLDGADFGLAPLDEPAVRRNRQAALVLVWRARHLALGAQVHTIQTTFVDAALGSPRLLGAALTGQLKF